MRFSNLLHLFSYMHNSASLPTAHSTFNLFTNTHSNTPTSSYFITLTQFLPKADCTRIGLA